MRHGWKGSAAIVASLAASLLVAVAPSVTAAGGHVPVWDHGPGGERYVAFGDSFAAGPGITPQRPIGCSRSERNFSSLVATSLGVQSFTDASCGGAKIPDLNQAQGNNPPQLDALGPDTTLVTFGTLGGNDVGLVGLAGSCITGDCAGTPDDANHQKVEATRQPLTDGIRATKLRAPDAVIVAVGYGTYLPPGGCPDVLPITAEEADYLQGLIDHLSDVVEEVAAAEDVTFVDMREIPGAVDHTACAAPDQQWIRAINTYGDGAPLHPSSAGMAAMAGQVRGVIEALWADDPVHPIPAPPAPLPTLTPAPSVTPTPVPTPTVDPHAALEARAKEALSRVRFDTWCRVAPGASGPTIKFRVRHGMGLVVRADFVIEEESFGRDRRAPFLVERRPPDVSGLHGRVRAIVVVRVGDVTRAKAFSARRPHCLR